MSVSFEKYISNASWPASKKVYVVLKDSKDKQFMSMVHYIMLIKGNKNTTRIEFANEDAIIEDNMAVAKCYNNLMAPARHVKQFVSFSSIRNHMRKYLHWGETRIRNALEGSELAKDAQFNEEEEEDEVELSESDEEVKRRRSASASKEDDSIKGTKRDRFEAFLEAMDKRIGVDAIFLAQQKVEVKEQIAAEIDAKSTQAVKDMEKELRPAVLKRLKEELVEEAKRDFEANDLPKLRETLQQQAASKMLIDRSGHRQNVAKDIEEMRVKALQARLQGK
jgi:hypothetical protein